MESAASEKESSSPAHTQNGRYRKLLPTNLSGMANAESLRPTAEPVVVLELMSGGEMHCKACARRSSEKLGRVCKEG